MMQTLCTTTLKETTPALRSEQVDMDVDHHLLDRLWGITLRAMKSRAERCYHEFRNKKTRKHQLRLHIY